MGILIVDDSEDIRNFLKITLEKAGFKKIFMAENASEAFGILGINDSLNNPNKVEIILMDNLMPGISGIEACKRIKKNKHLEDIPVLMLTIAEKEWALKEAFEAGVVDYLNKPTDKNELITRVSSFLKLKHNLDRRKQLTKKLEQANEKLRSLSLLDGLSGIANRRAFDDFFDREWRRSLRYATPLSIFMIDIDNFKQYNDQYGHQAGDRVLQVVAKNISTEVNRPCDLVARYGGEEFVVVAGGTDRNAALSLAENVRKSVESIHCLQTNKTENISHITISIGVASVVPCAGLKQQQLIQSADDALYNAKNNGRNRVETVEYT